jgi:hypothetical protein
LPPAGASAVAELDADLVAIERSQFELKGWARPARVWDDDRCCTPRATTPVDDPGRASAVPIC